MKSQLSLHERIRNANASQEVEKVKARHTYLHGQCRMQTGEWPISGQEIRTVPGHIFLAA